MLPLRRMGNGPSSLDSRNMAQNPPILIAGGGIGGLAAA